MRSVMIRWVLVLAIGAGYFMVTNGNQVPVAMLEESENSLSSSEEAIDAKPDRPRLFQSPDQIKTYLESLGKYYLFHNRNRFGKRGDPQRQQSYRSPLESKGFREYEFRSPL